MRPYSDYKAVGLPWVVVVPSHWEVLPLKSILRLRRQIVGDSHPDFTLLSLTLRGVIPRDLENATGKFPSSFASYQIVKPDDLVLCLFDVDETPRTVGWAKQSGMVTGAYDIFECRKRDALAFVYLLLLAIDNRKKFRPLYRGLRKTIPKSSLLSAKVPLPPADERNVIVRCFEAVDDQTSHFIQSKRQSVKLLREYRDVLIADAVLRGVSTSRLCHSQISWWGDIPDHWETVRAKNLFKEVDERSLSGTETLLSLRMYQGLVPHNAVSAIEIPHEALVGYKRVRPGQIVMNRMRAATGMFAVVTQPGLVSPDYAVFEPRVDLDVNYFLHLFKTPNAQAAFRAESKGLGTGSAGFLRLYSDRFGAIAVPVPPCSEQSEIAAAIRDRTREIDRSIALADHEIKLSLEYRTRLLDDLVCGQVDARTAPIASIYAAEKSDVPSISAPQLDDEELEVVMDEKL